MPKPTGSSGKEQGRKQHSETLMSGTVAAGLTAAPLLSDAPTSRRPCTFLTGGHPDTSLEVPGPPPWQLHLC